MADKDIKCVHNWAWYPLVNGYESTNGPCQCNTPKNYKESSQHITEEIKKKLTDKVQTTVETHEDFVNFISKTPGYIQERIRDCLLEKIKEKEEAAKALREKKPYEEDFNWDVLENGDKYKNMWNNSIFLRGGSYDPSSFAKVLADSKGNGPHEKDPDFEIWRLYFDGGLICQYCSVINGKLNKCSECTYKSLYSSLFYEVVDDDDSFHYLKAILDPSSVIKIPRVQKLCNEQFRPEVPTWEIFFNKDRFSSVNVHMNSLEKTIKELKSGLNSVKETMASRYHELEEIDLNIVTKEAQHYFYSNELWDEEVEEVAEKIAANPELADDKKYCAAIYSYFQTLVNLTDKIEDEKSALKKSHRENMEDMNALVEFQGAQDKELKEYLTHQKEMFDYLERSKKALLEIKELEFMDLKNLLLKELE